MKKQRLIKQTMLLYDGKVIYWCNALKRPYGAMPLAKAGAYAAVSECARCSQLMVVRHSRSEEFARNTGIDSLELRSLTH